MAEQITYKHSLKNKFLQIGGLLLMFFYLLNCFTPLRIHYDMLRYFGIMECIRFGCPADSSSAQDYLPYGYTSLLLLLSRLGILKSFTIVLVNCIYLFTGLYFIKKIFSSTLNPFLFTIIVLLNWTIMKFTMHPLSEMQFFFFSAASLFLFYQYTRKKKWLPLLLAFVFAGLAFLTRTIGVALVPALLLGLAWEHRKELINLIQKNKLLIIALIVLIAGVFIFSKQLGLNHYTGVRSDQFKGGVHTTEIFAWHFKEWTEIFFNTPFARVEHYLPGSSAKIAFVVAGVIFFGCFLYLLLKKKNIPFFVKVYLLAYCGIIFYWPFYDPRFWVPIIPFVAVVILQAPFNATRILRLISPFLLFIYGALGIVALGYLTYTSFDKKVFSRTQANGVYRNEYETHFYGKPLSDTATQIDPFIVHILQKYDR